MTTNYGQGTIVQEYNRGSLDFTLVKPDGSPLTAIPENTDTWKSYFSSESAPEFVKVLVTGFSSSGEQLSTEPYGVSSTTHPNSLLAPQVFVSDDGVTAYAYIRARSLFLNYETSSTLSITIHVSEGYSKYVRKTFNIPITDVDGEYLDFDFEGKLPNDAGGTSLSIPENNSIGLIVAKLINPTGVGISDNPYIEASQIVAVSSGSISDFTVSGGEIVANKSFSYATQQSVTVTVTGTKDGLSADRQVTLNILPDTGVTKWQLSSDLINQLKATWPLLEEVVLATTNNVIPYSENIIEYDVNSSYVKYDGTKYQLSTNQASYEPLFTKDSNGNLLFQNNISISINSEVLYISISSYGSTPSLSASGSGQGASLSITSSTPIFSPVVAFTAIDSSAIVLAEGKVVATGTMDPSLVEIRFNNLALPVGSVFKNTASGQKFIKVTGDAKAFSAIVATPRAEWQLSAEGQAAWEVLQNL